MNLQEQISRIQSMMGMITESHKDCGIMYEPELKKDLESTNIFDMVVNDSDELIHTLNPKKQRLSPTKKVYSVQKMTLTLSCDHRVVDGAVGAKFLKTLKVILENPLALML